MRASPTKQIRVTANCAAVVSYIAAVVSGEAPVASGNAAVACRLIRVTANIATVVSHIAPVHSCGARVACGFAAVAFGVGTVAFRCGTFACFSGGGAQASGREALVQLLDEIVPGRAIDLGEHVAILCQPEAQRAERGPEMVGAGVYADAEAWRDVRPVPLLEDGFEEDPTLHSRQVGQIAAEVNRSRGLRLLG